jgi:hypothetical protein
MTSPKAKRPEITTFRDHQVITPPHDIRTAVTTDLSGDDPIARAEAALAQLSGEFSDWMTAECDALDAARQRLHKTGFEIVNRESLYHAAHDIKGQAATFGFPQVADAADSLCRLIEFTPTPNRIPLALVDQHVDAIRAIIRESDRPDAEAVAGQLTWRLREVTEEFLHRENPGFDTLERMPSPPIVPGAAG